MRRSSFQFVVSGFTFLLILIFLGGCQSNQTSTATLAATSSPQPTVTSAPTDVPTAEVTAASVSASLQIYIRQDALTLYVPQVISLIGFQFEVPVRNNSNLGAVTDNFDALTQADGLAESGACYVYAAQGASPTLPDVCKDQVYKTDVAQADVFWFDSSKNRLLDLPIFQDGQFSGTTCSASDIVCNVNWKPSGIMPTKAPATATVAPTSVPTNSPAPTETLAASETPLVAPSSAPTEVSQVATEHVTVTPNTTPVINQTATAQGYVLTPTLTVIRMTTSSASLRQAADAGSAVIEIVAAGTKVITLEERRTLDGHMWYNVQLDDGKQGWLQDDALAFVGKPTASAVQSSAVFQTQVVNNNQWSPLYNTYDGVRMVLVPRGCFYMGGNQPNSSPLIYQCVQQPFWLDLTEVTNQQFADFGTSAKEPSTNTGLQQPRDWVSWQEASDFCSQKRGMRLPTELEWEFAASGPSNYLYPWGNSFIAMNLVYSPDNNRRLAASARVGSILSGMSWVGALDMSGNLFEWVSTDYDPNQYPELYAENESRAGNSQIEHVQHGGAYYNNEVDYMRFSYRGYGSRPDKYVGFRCARDFQKTDLSN